MRTINAQKDSFNYYLEEVEKKESAQRRRLIVLVMGLCVGFGVLGAILLFSFHSSQAKEDYVPFEELNSQKVETILAQQPAGFYTWDALTDIGDSIFSLHDYEVFASLQLGLLEELNPSFGLASPPLSTRYEATGGAADTTYPICLDSIICEVSGELKVDHPVYFHIANYDESNTYLMAYGEGSLKRIPSKHSFTFKNPGEYHIKITAFSPSQKIQIHTIRTVHIQPNNPFSDSSLDERETHS